MPKIKTNSYKGFTLVEVIAAFLLIGIVSALIIPQVNMMYQRATLYAQFRKVHSTLSNAVKISSMVNSEIGTWNMNPNNSDIIIAEYIKPYARVVSEKPIPPYAIKNLKVSVIGSLNNFVSSHYGGGKTQYYLSDGSSILVNEINRKGAVILADLNGEKTPNIIGRDIFFFLLQRSNNQVVPSVQQGSRNANCGGTPENGIIPGEGCAARIIAEGKMNY